MSQNSTTLSLDIDGMHCDACIQHVESALRQINGLQSSQVTLGQVVVTLDNSKTSKREVIAAITQDGQFSVTAFSIK